jgi:tetratricopeptide (TPR) repeat protein
LIQLAPPDVEFPPDEALRCYEKAISIDPKFHEAYESIGYYHDTKYDHTFSDFEISDQMFRKAIDMGAGPDSYIGLARVLAETGRTMDALALLEPPSCPYANEPAVKAIREEIAKGHWNPI